MSGESIIAEDGEIYITSKCKEGKIDWPYCGKEWSDGAGGQVKQISIWHRDLVYGIQVSYERNGKISLSPRHGGTKGDFEQIVLDEPITCVSGHYGSWCVNPEDFSSVVDEPYDNSLSNYSTVIRSLKFETGRATYGPFGSETGEPFSFKMRTGCAGFHGRSYTDENHDFLQAIGVYVRSFASKPTSDVFSPSISAAPSVVDVNENDEK